MIKLIIFDWDDVFMLGARTAYLKCYHQAIADLGVCLPKKEEEKRIFKKWGKHYQEELKELLKEKPELLNKAIKNYEKKAFGNTFIDSLTLIPGAEELLKKLSKKYILAIDTGNQPKTLKIIFKKFTVPCVFSQIITSADIDNVNKQKPHPYSIKLILKKQKISAVEAIFVGDSKGDVEIAKAAKVTPVVVLTGHLTKNKAKNLGVKYIIKNVTYLEKVLENINQSFCRTFRQYRRSDGQRKEK